MKEQESSKALARVNTAMPVTSMAELATAGSLLAQSGMFGINNPAAGFVVAATCHQQGISLMEFQRSYHIVEGRPSMRADAMLAEFRNRGGKYKIVENSTERAAADFEFEGQKYSAEYTMADARRTGDCFKGDGKTLKHTWEKRSDDMLWARMVSKTVRRLAPEINAGLYPPEEVQDFDDNPAPRRGEPIVITPEVAAARAATAATGPATATATPPTGPAIDYTVCPAFDCEYDGKPWGELPDEALTAALGSEALTATHKAAIRLVLDERKEGGAA